MGVRFPTATTNAILLTSWSDAAEHIVFTTPPLNLPLDFAQVMIWASLVMTVGTGGTGLKGFIRRGATLAGTAVNLSPGSTDIAVVAASPAPMLMMAIDTPGAVAGIQYSFSCSVTAQSAANNVYEGCMMVLVL